MELKPSAMVEGEGEKVELCPQASWSFMSGRPYGTLAGGSGAAHHAADAERVQRRGHLAHFGSATRAVDDHPIKIIVEARRPVGPGPARIERRHDLVEHPGCMRGKRTLGTQRLDALDHYRADHLLRRGCANGSHQQ